MVKYERRNEFRVWINREIIIKELVIYDKFIHLPKPLTINIQNISCSGALMLSNLDIPIGTCLFLELLIKDEILPIIIEIIRNTDRTVNDKFEYGCRFLQLSEHAKSKLRRYVFDQQVQFKKK